MTPPSVETTIKLILTDRSFNIPQFINQELTVFLTQIRSYLPSVQRTIWGNKYANAKGVIDALSRVFDFTTSNDFIPEIIVQLNMIFCHLFHPESSKLIRKPAISLLFKVVFLLDEDLISGIDGVFPLTVAFNCFARSDSERDIFYRPIPSGISPVIDSNSSPSNVEDAISALKLVFSNIIDNWNMKKHVCSHILFRCILSIIFPEIYDKMKVSNCGFSFISPAPSLLRYEINNFIVNFFSNGCDIEQLFTTGTNLSFIQYFLENMSMNNDYNDITVIFLLLNAVVDNDELTKRIISFSEKSYMKFADIVCNVLTTYSSNSRYSDYETNISNDPNGNFIIDASNIFLSKFFPLIFQYIPQDMIVTSIIELFHRHHYDKYASAFIMFAFLHSLMMSDKKEQELWECLTHLSIESMILSAVASRYAQYLAFLSFLLNMEVDEYQMKTISYKISARQKKFRENVKYELLVLHYDLLFTEPNELVRKYLSSSWKPYHEFDDLLHNLKIPSLIILGKSTTVENENETSVEDTNKNENSEDNLSKDENYLLSINSSINYQDKIELFLSAFDFYDQLESNDQKIAAFAPIYSFCHTMKRFCFLPPGIKYNHSAVYEICRERMFHGILEQRNPKIKLASFEILSTIINICPIENQMTSNQTYLWILSLCCMIFNTDPLSRKSGIYSTLNSIKHGITGISILCPVILKYFEKLDTINDENYSSFIASLPLFDNSVCNKDLVQLIKEKIAKTSRDYIDENIENYFDIQNMRKRAFYLLTKMNGTEYMLSSAIVMLGNELTQDNIDEENIQIVFNEIIKALITNLSAVYSIYSLFGYFEKLKNVCPNILLDFTNKVVDYTISLKETEKRRKLFYSIQMTALLCIHAGTILQESTLKKFIDFCSNISFDGFSKNDMTNFLTNIKTLISIYQNAYPYPESPLFPMYYLSSNNSNESLLFTTMNDSIMRLDYALDGISVTTQTRAGVYNWKMNNINSKIQKENSNSKNKFDFPDVIIPKNDRVKQNDFSSLFSSIVDSYEDEFNIQLEQVHQIYEENADERKEALMEKQYEFFEYIIPDKKKFEYSPIEEGTTFSSVSTIVGYNDGDLRPLPLDPLSTISVQKLYGTNHRFDTKIGVLYSGDINESQQTVLSKSLPDTSPHFREFLHGLGWVISLPEHSGFDGNLDMITFKSGASSVYYADFENQLMFHVAPLMPLSDDSQQIGRKRHIGNDPVQIIWSEKEINYNTYTITSQFNQAHIIIYPLNTALFRVDVKYKNTMKWFGPLRGSTIVSKKALPSLVRQTAIGAMNSYNISIEHFRDKLSIISSLLLQIIDDNNGKTYSNHEGITSLMVKRKL